MALRAYGSLRSIATSLRETKKNRRKILLLTFLKSTSLPECLLAWFYTFKK